MNANHHHRLLHVGKVEDPKTSGGSLSEDVPRDLSHTVSDRSNPICDPPTESEVRSTGGDGNVAMVTTPSGEDTGRGEKTNDVPLNGRVSLKHAAGGTNKRKLEHDVS